MWIPFETLKNKRFPYKKLRKKDLKLGLKCILSPNKRLRDNQIEMGRGIELHMVTVGKREGAQIIYFNERPRDENVLFWYWLEVAQQFDLYRLPPLEDILMNGR